jgi:hypothetical protein
LWSTEELSPLVSGTSNSAHDHPRPKTRTSSPFLEDYRHSGNDEREAREVIPSQRLPEVEHGKNAEYRQRDDLLDRLQLRRRELVGADAVRRYLETIFQKRNQPTHDDDFIERYIAVLEVSIPRKGHEDIRDGQQNNGFHLANGSFLFSDVTNRGPTLRKSPFDCAQGRLRFSSLA